MTSWRGRFDDENLFLYAALLIKLFLERLANGYIYRLHFSWTTVKRRDTDTVMCRFQRPFRMCVNTVVVHSLCCMLYAYEYVFRNRMCERVTFARVAFHALYYLPKQKCSRPDFRVHRRVPREAPEQWPRLAPVALRTSIRAHRSAHQRSRRGGGCQATAAP